jgi:NAD dependent epimerase/dehydratase family enzyme
VTNAEFTKTLGGVLSRPTFFPAPAFGLRLAFGEMADALLLASARVEPASLRAAGYTFKHPQLEGALRSILGAGE